MDIFQAVILAIVEGITEYLPVSSTGHMIIASSIMGIEASEFVKMFTVAIQFGAILSVVVIYWKRFFQTLDFYFKLLVAFLPAAILGFLFNDAIDAMLENVVVVAVSLLLGGIFLLFIDRIFGDGDKGEEQVNYPKALMIGFFQVIAMIPGVSRSAATIVGGLSQKLTRKAAAEFSFFLAVPTMAAATGYKMLKYQKEIGFTTNDVPALVIGNVVAFLVAWLAIRTFIAYLTKHGFRIFGWYRVIVGAAILILYFLGFELNMV